MGTRVRGGKIAWEQGTLVGPAGRSLYFCTTKWEQGAKWGQVRAESGCHVGAGRGGNSVDL